MCVCGGGGGGGAGAEGTYGVIFAQNGKKVETGLIYTIPIQSLYFDFD